MDALEDVAVLVDLDERRALVLGGAGDRLLQVLRIDVHGAGHERGVRAERERQRIERDGPPMPYGDDFVRLPISEVGEYCPLVSP